MLRFLILAALLPCALPVSGQTDSERFGLFAACRPMRVLVEDLSEAATKIGLTVESIETTAESRLRAARLYKADQVYPVL